MKPSRAARRHLPASPFNTAPVAAVKDPLEVSDRVTHDRYGLGRVVLVEDDATVCVDFGSGGVRRVRSAKLTRL